MTRSRRSADRDQETNNKLRSDKREQADKADFEKLCAWSAESVRQLRFELEDARALRQTTKKAIEPKYRRQKTSGNRL